MAHDMLFQGENTAPSHEEDSPWENIGAESPTASNEHKGGQLLLVRLRRELGCLQREVVLWYFAADVRAASAVWKNAIASHVEFADALSAGETSPDHDLPHRVVGSITATLTATGRRMPLPD